MAQIILVSKRLLILDERNGVLLDSKVNRKKGNTMLFLINEEMLNMITKKKQEQKDYLRSLKPWYKRWLA